MANLSLRRRSRPRCRAAWPSAELAGHLVTVCLSLERQLSLYDGEQIVAQHIIQLADRGWDRHLG